MYTREIQPPIASPIENGNPIIGTWTKTFDKVDLLETHKPYLWPLPRWVLNSRIKERQCFSVQNEDIMLEAVFCNHKIYRIAQVLIYNKNTGEKHLYRKFKPGKGWTLQHSLANTSIDSHSFHFYFRIHSWLEADIIRLDIDIAASRKNPSLTVHLAFNAGEEITPMAVSLALAEQRSMYAYKTFAPVRGDIVLDGKHISLKKETCSGFFCDYKGFFPYRMRAVVCNATGFTPDNRRYGFHIAENQAKEPNKNNENALWVDGKLTPLPPVLITMPSGQEGPWVIQDVEGMIDLTFTPKEQNRFKMQLIITNADFSIPIGYYNGMLITGDGEQIQIKNLPGIGEKLVFRV